jgi:tRNA G37 N-methylase TrmD
MRYHGAAIAALGGVLIAFILLIGSGNSVKNTESLLISPSQPSKSLESPQASKGIAFSTENPPEVTTSGLDSIQAELDTMNATRHTERPRTELLREQADTLIAKFSTPAAPDADHSIDLRSRSLEVRLQDVRSRLEINDKGELK